MLGKLDTNLVCYTPEAEDKASDVNSLTFGYKGNDKVHVMRAYRHVSDGWNIALDLYVDGVAIQYNAAPTREDKFAWESISRMIFDLRNYDREKRAKVAMTLFEGK